MSGVYKELSTISTGFSTDFLFFVCIFACFHRFLKFSTVSTVFSTDYHIDFHTCLSAQSRFSTGNYYNLFLFCNYFVISLQTYHSLHDFGILTPLFCTGKSCRKPVQNFIHLVGAHRCIGIEFGTGGDAMQELIVTLTSDHRTVIAAKLGRRRK